MSEAQKNMPNLTNALWASGHPMQVNIPLAKASHMAKPKTKRPNSIHGIEEDITYHVRIGVRKPRDQKSTYVTSSLSYMALFFSYSWIFQALGRVLLAWLGVMVMWIRITEQSLAASFSEESETWGNCKETYFTGDFCFKPWVLASQPHGYNWRRPGNFCLWSHPPRG